MADAVETSETSPGKRNRVMDAAMDNWGELLVTQEKRCRVSDLHMVFVAAEEIVKEHAQ